MVSVLEGWSKMDQSIRLVEITNGGGKSQWRMTGKVGRQSVGAVSVINGTG